MSLENRPRALAAVGEALDAADVSVEGGGTGWAGGRGIARFLVDDAEAAAVARASARWTYVTS